MPPVQIREMPDSTYEKLKERAKRDNRSISQEALTLIQDGLARYEEGIRTETDIPSDHILSEREINALLFKKKLEDRKEREDRIQKRRALFERIRNSDKSWIDPDAPLPVEIIRAMREDRSAW